MLYAWGEPVYVWLMVASIAANWAWLYLDYLLRETVPAAEGASMAEGYFGWFFPRECLATPNSIGEQCATLRKFYGYMAERGLVDRDD